MRDQTQKVPPDAEIIARQWALSQTIITDIVGTNVATRLPRGSSLPFLTLFRAGGALINPRSDAHIQNALLPMDMFKSGIGMCVSIKNAMPSASSNCLKSSFFSLMSRVSPL